MYHMCVSTISKLFIMISALPALAAQVFLDEVYNKLTWTGALGRDMHARKLYVQHRKRGQA